MPLRRTRFATVGFELQPVAKRPATRLLPKRFPRTAAFAATFVGGMVKIRSRKLAVCAAALSLLFAAAGCDNGRPTTTTTANNYALATRALSVFYQEFTSEHGGRPPQDEAEFRDFLATRQERLDAGGLTVDEILTGPQGEKWVVGYGKPIEIEGQKYIAYSSRAADGMVTVVNLRGGTQPIEQEKLPASESQ
jgi:hypothetical protein